MIHPDEWRRLCAHNPSGTQSAAELAQNAVTTQLLIYLHGYQLKIDSHVNVFEQAENSLSRILGEPDLHPVAYCRYNEKNLIALLDIETTPALLAAALQWLCIAGYLRISKSPVAENWDFWLDCEKVMANLTLLREAPLKEKTRSEHFREIDLKS